MRFLVRGSFAYQVYHPPIPDILQQIQSTIAHGSKHLEGLLSWHYSLKSTAASASASASSSGSADGSDSPTRNGGGGGNGASHGGIPKDPSLAGRHRSNTDPVDSNGNGGSSGKNGRAHDSAAAAQLEHVQNDKMWFLRGELRWFPRG